MYRHDNVFLYKVFSTLLLFGLVFSGLGSNDSAVAYAQQQPAFQKQSVLTTVRHGGWLDTINMSVVPAGEPISALQTGMIDIFAGDLTGNQLQAIKTAGLDYVESLSVYTELTLNPSGPLFNNGNLNPFSVDKIREATNWLVNRNYIAHTIYGDGARPKFVPLASNMPDYARYKDTILALESQYAYDFAKANTTITTEMNALGAQKNMAGKWVYNSQLVTLIFIIRTEDERLAIGNYIADQFELLGFTVDRQYKTRAEASPIWNRSNPMDGLWHLYTGGWITTDISRDDATNFAYFYTSLGSGSPLWQAYNPPSEFFTTAEKLWNRNFVDMNERNTLFGDALTGALKVSYRIWLVDGVVYNPFRTDLTVTGKIAGGVSTNKAWPYTLRHKNTEGGTVNWGNLAVLVDPSNPVAGFNWAYDTQWQIPTTDSSLLTNPYTGLPMQQRLESADVVVQEGLPVINSSPSWLTLTTTPQIDVPVDAWIDWDAANANWATVGNIYPSGLTAKAKVVVHYPAGMFSQITWHDGSPLSPADFILPWIMKFTIATPGTDIYDDVMVADLNAFKTNFKGIKFVSTEPLVIEYYTDAWQIDAEMIIPETWPTYNYGSAPWHVIALANKVNQDGLAAYGVDKSNTLGIPWLNLVGESTLDIMNSYLTNAQSSPIIPYPNVLAPYISDTVAGARYIALADWYVAHGHFWVGTGPYFLDVVDWNAKTLTLKNNTSYIDLADKWSYFEAPTQVISGNAGVSGATISYTDGIAKTVIADADGNYSLTVPYNWTGIVTPSKAGYIFIPANKSYSKVVFTQNNQNYAAHLLVTKTFKSVGAQDGWLLESSENSNLGGSMDSASATFRVGDDVAKKQYRGMLSFSTAILPDTNVITKITLKFMRQGIIGGGNPFSIFQGLMVDIKKGNFNLANLETRDFQTLPTKSYGPLIPVVSGNWYSVSLNNAAVYINKVGNTQIRLRFKLDDNNNTIANFVSIYSGNATTTYQPQLIIEYYVP